MVKTELQLDMEDEKPKVMVIGALAMSSLFCMSAKDVVICVKSLRWLELW